METNQLSRRQFAGLATLGLAAFGHQAAVANEDQQAEHWSVARSESCRWYERENFIAGRWQTTGVTTPIDRESSQLVAQRQGYIDECLVPDAILLLSDRKRLGRGLIPIDAWQDRNLQIISSLSPINRAAADPATLAIDFGDCSQADAGRSSGERRSRHGKPPSQWLRSLTAEEIRIWLARVEIQDALVSGMTFAVHLTRDHEFGMDQIVGLTETELAELHGAAHEGY